MTKTTKILIAIIVAVAIIGAAVLVSVKTDLLKGFIFNKPKTEIHLNLPPTMMQLPPASAIKDMPKLTTPGITKPGK